ncbi:MAG: hypothetical protein ACYSR6_04690 [Planctomycetota bacterium]
MKAQIDPGRLDGASGPGRKKGNGAELVEKYWQILIETEAGIV